MTGLEVMTIVSKAWPIFLGFILLIVTLAQAHYRIKVLEEKVKVAEENMQRQIIVAEKNKQRTEAVEAERVEKDRALEATERERIVTLAQIEILHP